MPAPTRKKLVLATDVLRTLSSHELEVAGGVVPIAPPTGSKLCPSYYGDDCEKRPSKLTICL